MRLLILAGIGLTLSAQTPEVRAVLQKKCFACHGPGMQMNGLRLDDGEAAIKGGYSGPSIIPGDSKASTLIDRLHSDKEKYKMPPAGPRLTEQEIAVISSWIDQGAKYPASTQAKKKDSKLDHWSFKPIRRPDVPEGRNAIDYFIEERLKKESFTPSPEAPKEILVRRVSLDLRGLPPTPEEVKQFVSDTSTNAYEKMVDRFLASPSYGEKWARQWLDLARYADSDGYEKDLVRPYAWRWRNWVINALNQDMPFDQFTIEQIAGDLLPNATTEQKVATGFHRNTLINREAGVPRAEDRFEQTINRTNTISTTWLGLTAGCAQCHDHKYDPISQTEYYQLFAFMDSIAEEEIDAPISGELEPWKKAQPEYLAKRTAILKEYKVPELQAVWEDNMRIAITQPGKKVEWDFALTSCTVMLDNAQPMLMTPFAERTQKQQDRLTNYFIRNVGPDNRRDKELVEKFKEMNKKLDELEASVPKLTQAYVIEEGKKPVITKIAVAGDYKRPGIEVQPNTPAVLPKLAKESSEPARLAFARWIVAKDNPLTARVIMNRTWQTLFGRGLVRTSDDFGLQGESPSHPELLDWLASEFMKQGWSQKQMLKQIVTSATYKQSSRVRPEILEKDPDNILLARQSRLRLSAEQIRDEALFASGLLDTRIGGPSIKPPQPASVAELTYANSNKWKDSEGADKYRRGLYIHFQRTAPYPQLMNFDAPEGTVACSQRRSSNTPLQSLNLLNDPVFFEAAQKLAERVAPLPDDAARVKAAFEYALGREPREREQQRLVELANREGFLTAARVILNLDEFITRE